MRSFAYCIVAVLLVIVHTQPFVAQTATKEVKGKIVLLGVGDRVKSANGNETVHGIANVGVGARVVFKPMMVWGDPTTVPFENRSDSLLQVTASTWTLTSKPTGSTLTDASIVDTATSGTSGIYYFKPDSAGSYTISVSAVTGKGTGTATLVISAARYVGIGARDLSTVENYGYASFNCAPCHSSTGGAHTDKFAGYAKTKHSTAVIGKMNGSYYPDYCNRCHTTGYNANAANNGFDDRAAAIGYVNPPARAGLYDSLLTAAKDSLAAGNDSLITMMGLFGIQCETCHGPAGEHKKTGDPALMSIRPTTDVCAPCHLSSDRHPRAYSWTNSRHSKSMWYDHVDEPYYKNRSNCSRCHTHKGFIDQVIKGNTNYPSNGYADNHSIQCATCHDPHDATGQHQLRRLTVRDACTGCHTTRLSGYGGLHSSHQGQMIQGIETQAANLELFLDGGTVQDIGGWELPGYTYSNSFHSTIEKRCAQCHMAPSPDFDPTFQSPDTLLNVVGGHTWNVKWTDSSGTHVNNMGCADAGCHGGTVAQVTAFVATSQQGIKVLLDTLKANLPPISGTNPEPKIPQQQTTTLLKAAAYNYYFVANDLSFGVHNNTYARGLLESSIEQIKLGAGAAEIVSVKDVPNDHGRRVQVAWNQFPAEKFAFNPVVTYGVWREDRQIGTKVTPKKNYTEMFLDGVVGEQYAVSGFVWTYLASVPASDFALYSYNAETLEDSSTTSNGTALTRFKVVGYAAGSAAVYSSQPASGYSVDNSTTNVEKIEGLPTTYALGQNYPNPFNPSTTITFALPEAGTVVLSVYTISGELVKTIAKGQFPAGNFQATWHGTDQNGAQVATGMYLYRIQSGTFSSVKKMIMLK